MHELSFDLHLHSCLSPCGDDDMLPSNIVGMAVVKGLDVIALTDHNTSRNCPAFLELAEAYGILAIPGMELCTSEEVHVVCLFPTLEGAMDFDRYVHRRIPPIPNDPAIFGRQLVVNAEDEIIGDESLMLINAANISFDQVHDLVQERSGIMIPAHIEKRTNSLLSNLGMIPEDSKFTCFELKHPGYVEQLRQAHPYLAQCRMITNSDAHYLGDIHEPIHKLSLPERSVEAVLRTLAQG